MPVFKFNSKADKLLFFMRSFLFPERCAVCGRLCKSRYFCKNCAKLLTPLEKKRCPRCGLPKDHCNCKHYFYYFDGIAAPFLNEGAAQTALYVFKFSGAKTVAPYFGHEMATDFARSFPGLSFYAVTAVPMKLNRKRKRGYNQAEVLARLVAKELGVPYRPLLRQTGQRAVQHKTNSARERFENIAGKFALCRGVDVRDKTVLLVDDIKTTGASLSECARQLKLGGASAVYCTTALITDYVKKEDQVKKISERVESNGNQHRN